MLKSIFVIIGTAIGAGFASGKEVYTFFNLYQENGFLGIILSNLLIGIVIYVVLKKSNKIRANTLNDLLKNTELPKLLTNTLISIINIFLLISFYIMVAGFSTYFKQELNVPQILTTVIVLILCYITFLKNIEGIAKINSIIIPILILIILIIGFKSNILENLNNLYLSKIELKGDWILKSIEYASYNSILLIPMLISINKYTIKKEKITSILTTAILFVLTLTIYLIMYKFSNIAAIEMPLVYIAGKLGNIFKLIYGLVIIFAIYSTMISSGYSFLKSCTNSEKTYKTLAIIICITAIFISRFKFSELVNLIYPIFGILGLIQIIILTKVRK